MNISSTLDLKSSAIKILIYAPSGAGKTFSASTLKDKTLIISAESGLLSLSSEKIDYIDMTKNEKLETIDYADRLANLSKVYNFLVKSDHKYETVFIDSLTEIAQIIDAHCEKKFPERKDGMVRWGEYNKIFTSLVKKFRDLPINVIFTCLSAVEKDENNKRFTTFSVFGAIAQRLPQYFDEVFYLHAAQNENKLIKRYFQTAHAEQITAKDRSGKLDLFEPVDFDKIFKKIRA